MLLPPHLLAPSHRLLLLSHRLLIVAFSSLSAGRRPQVHVSQSMLLNALIALPYLPPVIRRNRFHFLLPCIAAHLPIALLKFDV